MGIYFLRPARGMKRLRCACAGGPSRNAGSGPVCGVGNAGAARAARGPSVAIVLRRAGRGVIVHLLSGVDSPCTSSVMRRMIAARSGSRGLFWIDTDT